MDSLLAISGQRTPEHKQLHLLVDNYATHKHPVVQRWLKRHPRFHIHLTPTSASWLNMVERFFRDLTANRLRRGVFRDVIELVTAIEDYLDQCAICVTKAGEQGEIGREEGPDARAGEDSDMAIRGPQVKRGVSQCNLRPWGRLWIMKAPASDG